MQSCRRNPAGSGRWTHGQTLQRGLYSDDRSSVSWVCLWDNGEASAGTRLAQGPALLEE